MSENDSTKARKLIPAAVSLFLPYGIWMFQTYGGDSTWLAFSMIAGIFLYRIEYLGEISPMTHFFIGGINTYSAEDFSIDWLFDGVPFLIINIVILGLLYETLDGKDMRKGVVALSAISFLYSGFVFLFRMVTPLPLTAILALAVLPRNKASTESRREKTERSEEESDEVAVIAEKPLEVETAICPDCGSTVRVVAGTVRPDGSIVCTKCLKKFIP